MADIINLFSDSSLEKTVSTVILIYEGGKVLLGFKKRGFGVGKWNGFGGKIEKGETIIEAACRELLEESCLLAQPKDVVHFGTMHMRIGKKYFEIHAFLCEQYQGSPAETEEMAPKWFDVSEIPYDKMWDEAPLWFPLCLGKKKFTAWFDFHEDFSLRRYRIEEEDSSNNIF